MSLLLNCSTVLAELPVLARPAKAKALGFGAIESWWPFAKSVPPDKEVDAFIGAVEDAEVDLIYLNFAGGEMSEGDRGLVSWPGRSSEFQDSVAVALEIAVRLSVRGFNALYGNRMRDASSHQQDATAIANLSEAAKQAESAGAMVLLEPLSGAPNYPLVSAASVADVIARVELHSGHRNVRLLADLYHLTVNGEDLVATIRDYAHLFGHVQVADAPGRHEPGTGMIPFTDHLSHLARVGYSGWIGLEYWPLRDPLDMGWLDAPPWEALVRTEP